MLNVHDLILKLECISSYSESEEYIHCKDNKLIQPVLLSLKEKEPDSLIDEYILHKLKEVFTSRWSLVAETDFCYTRSQSGSNTFWIDLAKDLCKPGFCGGNYLKILMPSVTNEVCSISYEPLYELPLNQLILSDDKKLLINLETVFKNFDVRKVFVYFLNDSLEPKEFTQNEIYQIKYANAKYWQKYKNKVLPLLDENKSISIQTFYELKALINNSVFEKGVSKEYKTEDNEQRCVERAYYRFYLFLEGLKPSEKKALFRQYIKLNSIGL